ncbi:MAG: type II restriction endonuclease [Dehalococcoidales bacterium]|nr:type II restriction endonuclease [Dehalococcoidales bacterium]
MKKKDIQKAKMEFKEKLRNFVEDMRSYTLTDDGQWSVKGFIDVFKNVYTISSDTKIVSKIIEIHLLPKILKFAEDNGYAVVLADYQNWYPDLSFVSKSDPKIKFAVDIKTTYRAPEHPGHCNGFTLGSHGTYFRNRNSTKNIQFPYSEYLAHLCVGIIYTRCNFGSQSPIGIYKVKELTPQPANTRGKARIVPATEVDSLRSITSVVKDFQFFVCEKWEIASDKSGSGNTANVGSITKIDDILNCRGMFKDLGEKWFDDYWMNYGRITIKDNKGVAKKITKLSDFLKYKGKNADLIYPKAKKMKGNEG